MLRQIVLLVLVAIAHQQLLTSIADSLDKLLNTSFNPFLALKKQYQPTYANPDQRAPKKFPQLRASRLLQTDMCGSGVRVMAYWNTTVPGFQYPIGSFGYLCYCPYDFYGPSCENHISLLCNTKFTPASSVQFPQMAGQMQLGCMDYTGYMAFEGIKPNPENGKIANNTYRIGWTNNSNSYDVYGNLIRPQDPNITIAFSYNQTSDKFSFTNSYFYVQTKLISWTNTAHTMSLCTQEITAQNLAGVPFSFNCSIDHEKYKQYQPFGVYSLETSVIENQNNGERFHQNSIRSYRWNIYNPAYVPKGNWRSTKPYSIWAKLLGMSITVAVCVFAWKQFQNWRKHKSTMRELRQNLN